MVSRWTHVDGTDDHEVDPTYNGNNIPAYWSCHAKDCNREVLLDGGKVPITSPVKPKVKPSPYKPTMADSP